MNNTPVIAFIGAGRMASAMVRSLVQRSPSMATSIRCLGGDDDTAAQLADATGCRACANPAELLTGASTAVLAVKPQSLRDLDPELARRSRGVLLISILAGIRLQRLRRAFPEAGLIVRAMPNTPGQIGAGSTAWAAERPPSPEERARIEQILRSLGSVHTVREEELDAVTALSGSGPAYVFEFAAALREAGIAAGLQPELANNLATETLIGAARLLSESAENPEALRNAVTSPGGTTEAGLLILDSGGFRKLIERTVAAARDRSVELAAES